MSAAFGGWSLRVVVAKAVLALVALAPGAASAIDCGAVLTQDTALDADMACDPGEVALIIGASGITVDLKGHTLTGPHTGALDTGGIGVLVPASFTGVEIRNGTIRGFGNGVRLDTTSGNRVRTLTLVDNIRGVDVANAHQNSIEKNRIASSALDAVRLGGVSSGNVVRQNTLIANVFGLSVADDTSGNSILQNSVTEGIQFGIAVFTSGSANVVSRNVVAGTAGDGIVVSASSVGTVVSQNESTDNGRDGVMVDSATAGTRVERNTVTQNGDDGLEVRSAAATLSRNRAFLNSDLGIEAVAGVTDGGANVAFGNGRPVQCTGVVCAAN